VYYGRLATERLRALRKHFPVVVVVAGARQSVDALVDGFTEVGHRLLQPSCVAWRRATSRTARIVLVGVQMLMRALAAARGRLFDFDQPTGATSRSV
jgi:hypothetical protein